MAENTSTKGSASVSGGTSAPNQTKHVFSSGASSRKLVRDYTLLVRESVAAIVDRHQFGIDAGHARGNWQSGKDDPNFIRDRVNHAFDHFLSVISGVHEDGSPTTFADVQAILCNLQMVTWWRENGTGLAAAFPYLAKETKQA